jgi:hypothetical protein
MTCVSTPAVIHVHHFSAQASSRVQDDAELDSLLHHSDSYDAENGLHAGRSKYRPPTVSA